MARKATDELFRRFDRWGFDDRGWSRTTRRKYYLIARAADSWLVLNRGVSLAWAKPRDLQAYLFSTPPSAANRNNIRQGLVGFGRFLVNEGLSIENAAVSLPRLRLPEYLPKPLPSSAAQRVERVAPTFGPMVEAMVMLFLYGGMRKTEVRTLQRSAYQDGWLRVTGKRGKTRTIPLHPAARDALDRWLSENPSRWVFPSPAPWIVDQPVGDTWVRNVIWTVGDAADIDHLHPHAMRHSAATELLEQSGGDLRAVQVYLGHQDPKTTAIYTKVKPGRLAELVKRMSYDGDVGDRVRGGDLLPGRPVPKREGHAHALGVLDVRADVDHGACGPGADAREQRPLSGGASHLGDVAGTPTPPVSGADRGAPFDGVSG